MRPGEDALRVAKLYPTRRTWGTTTRNQPLQAAVKHTADVVAPCEVGEEGAEVRELRVVGVVEPARDGHRVVRVEDVRRGRVVDDDRVRDRPPELREVLRADGKRVRRVYACMRGGTGGRARTFT